MRISHLGLIVAGGLALSACAYGGYGRQGGISVGLGSSYGGYGYPYGGYGYGYGSPYWGWYDGFYYPGTGFYVYDRFRRPYYWNDRYRRYWTERRDSWQRSGTLRPVWESFGRGFAVNRAARSQQSLTVDTTSPVRTQTRQRTQRIERESARSERAQARRARRVERDDRP
jgi:hypothetical protein